MKFDYFIFLLVTKINSTYVITLTNDLISKSNVNLPIIINNTIVIRRNGESGVKLKSDIYLAG